MFRFKFLMQSSQFNSYSEKIEITSLARKSPWTTNHLLFFLQLHSCWKTDFFLTFGSSSAGCVLLLQVLMINKPNQLPASILVEPADLRMSLRHILSKFADDSTLSFASPTLVELRKTPHVKGDILCSLSGSSFYFESVLEQVYVP